MIGFLGRTTSRKSRDGRSQRRRHVRPVCEPLEDRLCRPPSFGTVDRPVRALTGSPQLTGRVTRFLVSPTMPKSVELSQGADYRERRCHRR